jgi:hypothetical protein
MMNSAINPPRHAQRVTGCVADFAVGKAADRIVPEPSWADIFFLRLDLFCAGPKMGPGKFPHVYVSLDYGIAAPTSRR